MLALWARDRVPGVGRTHGMRSVEAGAARGGELIMAKSTKREWVFLQCTETGDLNYRTQVNVQGGMPKLELKKYSPRLRKHTVHKVKRK